MAHVSPAVEDGKGGGQKEQVTQNNHVLRFWLSAAGQIERVAAVQEPAGNDFRDADIRLLAEDGVEFRTDPFEVNLGILGGIGHAYKTTITDIGLPVFDGNNNLRT
jgi:hypothetical protein